MSDEYPTQIRWKQRFENYQKALILLKEPFLERTLDQISLLEQQGIIQRFEMTYELGWKVLKDYLAHNGTVVEPALPRPVIKQAFASGIIQDGEGWIDMLEDRNELSHAYSFEAFAMIIQKVASHYLGLLQDLETYLVQKS